MTTPNRNIQVRNAPRFGTLRQGWIPDIITLHTSGWTKSSAINTIMNPANNVSYHYLISLAGDITQLVDIRNTAFHAGLSADLRRQSLLAAVRTRNVNPNLYTIGIAFGDLHLNRGRLTQAQIESVIWLIQCVRAEVRRIWGREIPIDRNHIVGHGQINPVTRSGCPGPIQWDEIMSGLEKEDRYESEDEMVRINTIDEVPAVHQPMIRRLIQDGIIRGSGKTDANGLPSDMNLTEDMIRSMAFTERIIQKSIRD